MVKSTQPVSVQVLDDSLIKRNSVTNCQSVCFRSRMAALIAAGGEGMCPASRGRWDGNWVGRLVDSVSRYYGRPGIQPRRDGSFAMDSVVPEWRLAMGSAMSGWRLATDSAASGSPTNCRSPL